MDTHVPIARLKSMNTLRTRSTVSGVVRRRTDRRARFRRLASTVTGMVPISASGVVQQALVGPARSARREFMRSDEFKL